ncbi:MAG: hypothetical protein GF375_07670 [Candidatus Omnitrophica bacterium]|nr:hypothetical protein [Candidatus Omnitrophota bacterium]
MNLDIKDDKLHELVKQNIKDVIVKYENSGQIVPPVAAALKEDFGIDSSEPKFLLHPKRVLPAEATVIEPGRKPTKKNLIDAVKLANEFIANLKQERKDLYDAALHYLGFQGAENYSCAFLFDFLAKLRNEEATGARRVVGKFFGLNVVQTDNLSDPETAVINVLNKYKEFWRDINEAINMIEYVFDTIDTDKMNDDDSSMLKSVLGILKARHGKHFAPGINPVIL